MAYTKLLTMDIDTGDHAILQNPYMLPLDYINRSEMG